MPAQTHPSSGWALFGKVIVVLGAVVATAILRGLVLSILWGWFVEPLGVPAVNVAGAIGLALIVGMFTAREDEEDKKKLSFGERFLNAFFSSVVGAVFALALGFLVHLCV